MAEHNRNQAQVHTSTRTGAAEIDAGLRSYMLSVYNLMALGVAFTGVLVLYVASQPALVIMLSGIKWFIFFGLLGYSFFVHRLVFSSNKITAHVGYWVYAGLWGLLIAPFTAHYLGKDPSIVAQALLITSVTFGATSLFGYTTKRDLSPFRTFLLMSAFGLFIAIWVNYFFLQSTLFSLFTSGLVVLVFSAITAWETQAIKEMYFAGDDESTARSKGIFGALMLYGSFVVLFIHILNILGIMRSE